MKDAQNKTAVQETPEREAPLRPITVSVLKELCDLEMKKGHGDKIVLVTDDDEANGYHALWYAFSSDKDSIEDSLYYSRGTDFDHDKIVLLG